LRILDDASDKKLDHVSVFLTKEEAIHLRGYLNQLLDNPKLQHFHLSSSDYQKEINICLYDDNNIENLSQRSIKLIREDK
jgi:hypothetical protein